MVQLLQAVLNSGLPRDLLQCVHVTELSQACTIATPCMHGSVTADEYYEFATPLSRLKMMMCALLRAVVLICRPNGRSVMDLAYPPLPGCSPWGRPRGCGRGASGKAEEWR